MTKLIDDTDKKEVFTLGMDWSGKLIVCLLYKRVIVYLFDKFTLQNTEAVFALGDTCTNILERLYSWNYPLKEVCVCVCVFIIFFIIILLIFLQWY